MTPTSTPADVAVSTEAPRAPRWTRLPIISHYRQSVGLQRGMLVVGLVLTAIFLLTALFAPLLSPYGFS
jgi:peptide/nickel transport system permease protein